MEYALSKPPLYFRKRRVNPPTKNAIMLLSDNAYKQSILIEPRLQRHKADIIKDIADIGIKYTIRTCESLYKEPTEIYDIGTSKYFSKKDE